MRPCEILQKAILPDLTDLSFTLNSLLLYVKGIYWENEFHWTKS